MSRRTGIWFATAAAAVAAAAGVASFTYQTIAEARDRRRFPPPGQLVDIGGRRRLSREHEDYSRAQDRHTDDFLPPRRSVHRRPTHGRLASCGN